MGPPSPYENTFADSVSTTIIFMFLALWYLGSMKGLHKRLYTVFQGLSMFDRRTLDSRLWLRSSTSIATSHTSEQCTGEPSSQRWGQHQSESYCPRPGVSHLLSELEVHLEWLGDSVVLYVSQFSGFLCPVHTPDGTPCGLLNHLAASCRV